MNTRTAFHKRLLFRKVLAELYQAEQLYPVGFRSEHEGFAVLLEEVEELKAEVWKKPAARNRAAMLKEAVQVAAMAFAFVLDAGLIEAPEKDLFGRVRP